MIKRLRLFVCLLISLLICTPSFAALTERYANCGLGTGNNDGTSEANAWQNLQIAFDNVAAGQRINVISTTTCTIAATIDVDTTAGTDDLPIVLQGYTSSIGDHGIAVIDADSAAVNCFLIALDDYNLIDIECKNSTGDGILTTADGDELKLLNVYINNTGDDCLEIPSGSAEANILGCELTACGAKGINTNSGGLAKIFYNYIHDSTGGSGILIGSGSSNSPVGYNIIDTITGHGISSLSDSSVFIGNTIYNISGAGNDSIDLTNDEGAVIINNIFDTAADYNIGIDAGGNIHIQAYNNFSGGVSGDIEIAAFVAYGGKQTESGLNTSTFAPPANLDDDGFPQYFDNPSGGSTIVSHYEIGAVMIEETAGGGGGAAGGELFVF